MKFVASLLLAGNAEWPQAERIEVQYRRCFNNYQYVGAVFFSLLRYQILQTDLKIVLVTIEMFYITRLGKNEGSASLHVEAAPLPWKADYVSEAPNLGALPHAGDQSPCRVNR